MIALDTSDSSTEESELPERCRLLKMANTATTDRCGEYSSRMFLLTYIRMTDTIDQLERAFLPADDGSVSHKGIGRTTPANTVSIEQQEIRT